MRILTWSQKNATYLLYLVVARLKISRTRITHLESIIKNNVKVDFADSKLFSLLNTQLGIKEYLF